MCRVCDSSVRQLRQEIDADEANDLQDAHNSDVREALYPSFAVACAAHRLAMRVRRHYLAAPAAVRRVVLSGVVRSICYLVPAFACTVAPRTYT